MSLNARDMGDARRLAQLAADPQGTSRENIYIAVASLYRSQAEQLSEHERQLMREILERLTQDVEMAIRIALAEKLADDPNAPLDLILLLVDDKIEVARPIILRNRRLTDRDLLNFIADADELRQTLCAQRPHIGEPVTEALARSESESVLVALVLNATARIGASTFETLVEKSRRVAALQEPLAGRADLPDPLATRMCAWVSDALKAHIVENRKIPQESVASILGVAAQSVQAKPKLDSNEGARKLVDKLATAGQLRAGFLLRVLQQGQSELFDLGFAKLLELSPPQFRRLFYASGPRSVALACRAVGIDRSVFQTVFGLSQRSHGGAPILTPEQRADIDNAFMSFTKSDAFSEIHKMTATASAG